MLSILVSVSAISVQPALAQSGPVYNVNTTHITVGEINQIRNSSYDLPGVVRVDSLNQQIQNVNKTQITVGEINRIPQGTLIDIQIVPNVSNVPNLNRSLGFSGTLGVQR
jgi:hypothetical protein